MKKNLLTILFLGLVFGLNAQQLEQLNRLQETYPNANRIRVNQEEVITLEIVDGEIKVDQTTIEEELYLSKSATYNSKQSINYSSFFHLKQIEAKNTNWINGKPQSVKVEDFKVKDDLESSFYDDNKTVNFIYPNLEKGSKTYLKYSYDIKNPRFLSSFYFGSYLPITNSKLKLIVDNGIELSFKSFNLEGLDIKFEKEKKRKQTIYTWTSSSVPDYKFEENSPNGRTILPHVIPVITSFTVDGKTTKLADSVDDLYKWYFSLTEEVRSEKPSPELVSTVKEITKNCTSDYEKVSAIYEWVQRNIKYIAFEYALGGFVPRFANDVFAKKYGDCKDNSSLLYAMLKIAGLKGYFTWIGTRDLPYSYSDLPTPLSDNHMILTWKNGANTYFLDATGRYANLMQPTSFIQGKEALIGIDSNEFLIETVPLLPATSNAIVDKSSVTLNGNNLEGSSNAIVTGFQKVNCFYGLENMTTEEKTLSYFNSLLEKGNNSFLISKFQVTNEFDYYEPFEIAYDFEIKNAVNHYGNETYVNLNLNQDLYKFATKRNRKNALEFDYLEKKQFQTEFIIPEEYKIDYLPSNFALDNEFFNSSIAYEVENGKIKYTHQFELKKIIIPAESLKEYNDNLNKVNKAFQEVIVLVED
ncbi:DUF3857 domain-containing protein [Croceivirga thetidis]|uniref:DUF3857 domain-containing transglutaminase family protein n=1 Tax=Croceivirga thetidis TaxID=2721623 RepID=A0ABX1GT52_9FLAO|nr:DUF3857 domain-containing protein [Croceivirga thetidis]NKI33143.1 DUF3857 domain-containing transglutaminase family protein [Croceivirga thetidis]